MSKCNKCKYEYHPMITKPCVLCREQYGEILWEYAEIVDKPKGTEQDNGEYCSQSTDGYDSYWGHYYYPLDNGKYLKVYYEC